MRSSQSNLVKHLLRDLYIDLTFNSHVTLLVVPACFLSLFMSRRLLRGRTLRTARTVTGAAALADVVGEVACKGAGIEARPSSRLTLVAGRGIDIASRGAICEVAQGSARRPPRAYRARSRGQRWTWAASRGHGGTPLTSDYA